MVRRYARLDSTIKGYYLEFLLDRLEAIVADALSSVLDLLAVRGAASAPLGGAAARGGWGARARRRGVPRRAPPPPPPPAVLPGPWPPVVYYQTGPGPAGADARTVMVSGRMTVDRYVEGLLLAHLPPAVRIGAGTSAAQGLRPVLGLLSDEAADPSAPGSLVIRRQLTHVLLVQVLRAALATATGPAGWRAALADAQVGAALAAIHTRPEQRWSVAGLAREAAMSRSSFAARFRALVGQPPLEYLIAWRMHRAAYELRTTSRSVASVGAAVGYPAETTFSSTFRRVIGQPPGRYRHTARRGDEFHGRRPSAQ